MDSPVLSSPNLKKQRPQDPFSPGFLESNRLLSNINRQIQVSGGDPVIFYDDSIIKTKSWQYSGVSSTPNMNMNNSSKPNETNRIVISDDESSEEFNDELLTEDSNILHNDDNASHGEHDVVDGELSKLEANLPYLTEEAAMAMEVTPEDLAVSIQERVRRLYSTTSTVLVKDTLSSPNSSEILFCIAAVLQAQIFENDSLPMEKKALHPEFNLIPLLPPEDGGPVEQVADAILAQETQNDEELRDCILRGVVPSIDTIVRYLLGIHRKAGYSSECNIIAIIYLNRITSLSGLPITSMNWRSLWVVSVILAQKVWSDTPMKTSLFHSILPSVTKKQLKDLEMKALCLLQYCTIVKPSLYAKYYFELRQLFTDIIGNKLDMQFSMKPLSIIQAKFLEMRTNYIPYVKHKDNRIRRMDKSVNNKTRVNSKTTKKSVGSGHGGTQGHNSSDGSNHGSGGSHSNNDKGCHDPNGNSEVRGKVNGVDMSICNKHLDGLGENHDHNVSLEANTSIESMHSASDSNYGVKDYERGNQTSTMLDNSISHHHSKNSSVDSKSPSDDKHHNGRSSHGSHVSSSSKKKPISYKSTPKPTNNWLMEDISPRRSSSSTNSVINRPHSTEDTGRVSSSHRKSSKSSSSSTTILGSSSSSSNSHQQGRTKKSTTHRGTVDVDVDLNIDGMDVNGGDTHSSSSVSKHVASPSTVNGNSPTSPNSPLSPKSSASTSTNWASTRSDRSRHRGIDKLEVRPNTSRVALKPSTFEDVTRTDTSRYVIS